MSGLLDRFRSSVCLVARDPYDRPTRVRIVAGEHAGQEALFEEVRRMIVDGDYGPGRMLPVEVIDGPHVHLRFEDVEWLDSPAKEWSEGL